MKTRKQIWRQCQSFGLCQSRRWRMALAVALVGGAALTSCQEYDLDQKSPEGWGNSIYSWLDDQGNYTNTVRLIDDLDYREVLAKTGSKTLFVADDAAYERFFQNNSWGVSKYDDLTPAQKKMLLRGNMLGNSIQLNSLSTIQGNPLKEGQAMRRFSELGSYDTVPVLKPQDMPDNEYWQPYRESGKDMVCREDGSDVPMLLFLEAQLSNNRITNDDYNFLFNHTTNRQAGDASVNGVDVVEDNIRCANGFIHRTAEVVTPLPNMAEKIAHMPNTKIYNRLLERFCAPYPDGKDLGITERYNYIYNANVDTVYTKRFFNNKTVGGAKTPSGKDAKATLKFDPEWNSYYSASIKDANEGQAAEQRDMAVMMVPTDDAMREYWTGAGKPLSENYATWDDVPDDVIAELLNVNMLSSFISSVPSKFDGILNDANDPMGVNVEDINEVSMACNGAIYLTNRVYSPTAYVSVSFPALINQTMKIIDWAIKKSNYKVYLNALGTDYSFFIPTNDALLEYIDPCSYGKKNLQLLSFRYDGNNPNEDQRVYAVVYNYDEETHQKLDSVTTVYYTGWDGNDRVLTSLKDILDTHIVIGKIWEGKNTYYRSKNGAAIRVLNATDEQNMTVEGSYQMNEGQPLHIARVYDQRKKEEGGPGGNGKTYILDGQPIMGTRKTVYDLLAAHPNYFSKFLELLEVCPGLLETTHNLGTGKPEHDYACGGQNLSVFNTYHYTIYVPSNDAIEQLQNEGKLPRIEDLEGLPADAAPYKQIEKFLKYHIQDNALYIGAQEESGNYETSLINEKNNRFYMLTSKLTANEIEVVDGTNTTHKVTKMIDETTGEPLYNLQAREYLYRIDSNTKEILNLYTTSSAVIHLIDSPLSLGN